MQTNSGALAASSRALKVLVRLNIVAAGLVAALLIASLLARSAVMPALGIPAKGSSPWIIGAGQAIMVLGLVSGWCLHRVFSGLQAIVGTVEDGDPFTLENASRLRAIAWAVIALELLHTAIVLIASGITVAGTPVDIRWSLNVTRWLVVLMLFVLAGVFERGAVMRDDLAGTV